MRIFELSTHVNSISRGDGRSATAAAAYRACCVIECEREGRTHDYTRKQGLELAEIILPKGAPAWAHDRGKLWNTAELAERNKDKRAKTQDKANAKTAREFFFSIPAELSPAGRLNVARTIARHLVETHGVAADLALHLPGKEGDERNFHCHLLTTTRRMGPKGLGAKAREWDELKEGAALAKAMRAFIAGTLNAELKAEGKSDLVHVEHRSFKDRGSSQTPQQHQGPGRTHELRKRQGQARAAWYRQVAAEQRERHAKELASLKFRQDFSLQTRLAELAQRARAGAASIKRELAEQRRADAAPDGLRKLFLTVTGRAGREAFDRQTREAQRVAGAQQQRDALKGSLRTERLAYVDGQVKERTVLIDRHKAEDGQLRQALAGRVQLDRAQEVVARRPTQQGQTREREEPGRNIGRELSP